MKTQLNTKKIKNINIENFARSESVSGAIDDMIMFIIILLG
ncbi:hypothetical protein SAMN06297164_2755 [Nitrosomonas ureae]|uniref:Uncharacterized protein n=1 Tax=Nitrosomonas ureae TaxID=44577 RepID=A0A286AFL1_9PROT|nr:hypothetical protein SAMN06297164_2755 [Nitrosomonas ureae]